MSVDKAISDAADRPTRRAATILDVARRAGVSTATVSRALAAPDQVATKTRERVFEAISETGYTPNVIARNLRARSSKMVLTLLPGIGHSFYSVIINSLEEALTEAGYGVLFGDTRNDPKREAHYDRLVRSGQVDGVLLFTGRLLRDDFADLVPVTLVCNEITSIENLSVVEIANRDAARSMVQYLISLGHRRIAHITGPATNVEAQERVRGYRDALVAAGLPVDENLIWPGSFSFVAGARGGERFLSLDERPTAIFAASDEIAIGCIKVLKDGRVRVPDDVSVAGFDGIDYSAMYDPALTTVLQPRAELGRLAAEDLVRRMSRDTPRPATRRIRLPCSLVIRDSVAPPRDRLSEPAAPGHRAAAWR